MIMVVLESWYLGSSVTKVRFKVVVGIAEVSNYLHNECSPSVIRRDIKSLNILLSDELEPQVLQAVGS